MSLRLGGHEVNENRHSRKGEIIHSVSNQELPGKFKSLPEQEEFIAKQIVHAAFTVHKRLGPGLLENILKYVFVMNWKNES